MIGRPLAEPRTGFPGRGSRRVTSAAGRFGNRSDTILFALKIEARQMGVYR